MKTYLLAIVLVAVSCKKAEIVESEVYSQDVISKHTVSKISYDTGNDVVGSILDYVVLSDSLTDLSKGPDFYEIVKESGIRCIGFGLKGKHMTNTFVYLNDSLYDDSKANWAYHINFDGVRKMTTINRVDELSSADEKQLERLEALCKINGITFCILSRETMDIENQYFDMIESKGLRYNSDALEYEKKILWAKYNMPFKDKTLLMVFADRMCG